MLESDYYSVFEIRGFQDSIDHNNGYTLHFIYYEMFQILFHKRLKSYLKQLTGHCNAF